nr:hypothetical protein [Tanacetum cinerariifolium]
MSDFPNEGSFWNLLNSANMGSESTSNSQFPGFSSQAPGRVKCTAKKGKVPELIGDVTLRWKPEEETLLAECFVAASEDRNVGRPQPKDTLWFRVLNEFNRNFFQKRTNDMLSSKWTTLNHHCQKFNAINKRCNCLKKSGENKIDLMKRARGIYRDEENNAFNHEDASSILRKHTKWNAPDPAPVDLTKDEYVSDEHVSTVNIDELFGPDARPRPPGKQRPGKKTKFDTSASTGGSSSSTQIQGVYVTRASSQTESRRKGIRGVERERPDDNAYGRVEISRP